MSRFIPAAGSRRRRRTPLALLVAIAALAAACGSSGDDTQTAETGSGSSADAASTTAALAADEPKPGGKLTFALAADPTCIDPQQAGANAALNVGRQIVDSLTDQDPETGEIVPWLASSWEVDPEAKTFTFKLRPDLTFSDGSPLDAAAVKANFDAIVALGAKAPLGSSYLAGYVGTTVVDPLTAKVEFGAPNVQFLQASSTMSLGLLSPATVTKDPAARCTGDLVGSGPFTVESYTANQSAVLTKRAGYESGSSLAGHTGDAYLDTIEFSIIPESGVRLGALQSGQVTAISDVQPQDEPQFESGDNTILTRPNPGLPFGLQPNVSRPLLGEEAVRVALSKAINREELNATVLTPRYKPATSVLATASPGWSDQSASLAFDLDGANKLLDDAGWVKGADGIREKNGQRLSLDTIWVPLFNASGSVLQLVQQQAKAAGIELALRQLTLADSQTVQASGDYDLVYYNLTRVDPDVLRTIFSSKGANRGHITDPALDALLDQQAATTDTAAREKVLTEIQQTAIAKGYFVPLFELAQVHGLGPSVKGLHFEASSRLNFYDTWLDA